MDRTCRAIGGSRVGKLKGWKVGKLESQEVERSRSWKVGKLESRNAETRGREKERRGWEWRRAEPDLSGCLLGVIPAKK